MKISANQKRCRRCYFSICWRQAFHRAFDYVNLSNMCSKQAFNSTNRRFLYSQSVSSNLYIFGRSPYPSKVLRLSRSLKIAATYPPLRASTEIAWLEEIRYDYLYKVTYMFHIFMTAKEMSPRQLGTRFSHTNGGPTQFSERFTVILCESKDLKR